MDLKYRYYDQENKKFVYWTTFDYKSNDSFWRSEYVKNIGIFRRYQIIYENDIVYVLTPVGDKLHRGIGVFEFDNQSMRFFVNCKTETGEYFRVMINEQSVIEIRGNVYEAIRKMETNEKQSSKGVL